jgi:hypothetical protein
MDNNVLLIVLTENHWLYAGLAALQPEITSQRMDFSNRPRTEEFSHARRIFIVVDSAIFLQGEWMAFTTLLTQRPDASVVWLMWDDTGRLLPEGTPEYMILKQKQDVASLHNAILQILRGTQTERNDACVSPVVLTQTEFDLLPSLMSRVNIPKLARVTGIPTDKLYRYRYNIMKKTGFRQPVFLQLVYERNNGLPGVTLTEKILFSMVSAGAVQINEIKIN